MKSCINAIGLFQLKFVSSTLRILDIWGIIQGVPFPYMVEDIGHPGGPSSIYSRGYRTSRGFFKNFQVFTRKSMGLGYLWAQTFKKIDILNVGVRILTGKAHFSPQTSSTFGSTTHYHRSFKQKGLLIFFKKYVPKKYHTVRTLY